MHPHPDLIDFLSTQLGESLGPMTSLSGGDISRVCRLEGSARSFLLKINNGADGEAMFKAEKLGLEAIADSGKIQTPEVYYCGRYAKNAVLVIEFIENQSGDRKAFTRLGKKLAGLHRTTADRFGWKQDNFIGKLKQSNQWDPDWTAFYVEQRLWPQIELAVSKRLLNRRDLPDKQKFYDLGKNLFSDITPSLLHGDLWSGNFLISRQGVPYLIDPAVYYGHCEVDLAMSRLFGGFPESFYQAYFEEIPAANGAAERNDIYQLYYLLVHLNMFGSSYYHSVRRIFDRYF